MVRRIVQEEKGDEEADDEGKFNYISGTRLAIGSRSCGKPPACWQAFDVIINCTPTDYEENTKESYKGRYLKLPIPEGKKGQYTLFECIPTALNFVRPHLINGRRILIHCAKGNHERLLIS